MCHYPSPESHWHVSPVSPEMHWRHHPSSEMHSHAAISQSWNSLTCVTTPITKCIDICHHSYLPNAFIFFHHPSPEMYWHVSPCWHMARYFSAGSWPCALSWSFLYYRLVQFLWILWAFYAGNKLHWHASPSELSVNFDSYSQLVPFLKILRCIRLGIAVLTYTTMWALRQFNSFS